MHSGVALDVIVPTDSYDRARFANPGRNYWAIQPVYTASYVNSNGWNWDVKVMYDFNFKNRDTNYKSGQEFHFDYALGYGIGNHWVAGVGGYAYKQTTGDKLNGLDIGNKGEAFAIGPSVKYDNSKGFVIMAKYQKESGVKNRAEGESFWIKTILPI